MRRSTPASPSATPWRRRLAETADKEVWNGTTLVGPHRDDVVFEMDGRPLASFASRGQQRTAILAFKLAEVDLLTALDGRPPLLLLDDVFSELDPDRRSHLVRRIAELPQAFVTTTTLEDLDPALRSVGTAWAVTTAADGTARLERGAREAGAMTAHDPESPRPPPPARPDRRPAARGRPPARPREGAAARPGDRDLGRARRRARAPGRGRVPAGPPRAGRASSWRRTSRSSRPSCGCGRWSCSMRSRRRPGGARVRVPAPAGAPERDAPGPRGARAYNPAPAADGGAVASLADPDARRSTHEARSLAVRLQLKLGAVTEQDRLPDSPDTVVVVEPSVGSVGRTKGNLYLLVTSRVPGQSRARGDPGRRRHDPQRVLLRRVRRASGSA